MKKDATFRDKNANTILRELVMTTESLASVSHIARALEDATIKALAIPKELFGDKPTEN